MRPSLTPNDFLRGNAGAKWVNIAVYYIVESEILKSTQ